jgi:hypothetical protein
MAALQAAKKYATLPPTVRTLASGVPNAPSLNLSARTSDAHHHGHHEGGGRSDSPSKWTGGYQLSSNGLVNKSFATGKPLLSPSLRHNPGFSQNTNYVRLFVRNKTDSSPQWK